ncbi:hypothetical protein PUN28_008628 [Cardiocondyla obscurior]|uniref:Uncharacterized protein n=1 Tax=Cardiocondyla obscurior TaxID=286306 RepID=A0AAW2G1B3_9HYME
MPPSRVKGKLFPMSCTTPAAARPDVNIPRPTIGNRETRRRYDEAKIQCFEAENIGLNQINNSFIDRRLPMLFD